jgi:hypothetical protein
LIQLIILLGNAIILTILAADWKLGEIDLTTMYPPILFLEALEEFWANLRSDYFLCNSEVNLV